MLSKMTLPILFNAVAVVGLIAQSWWLVVGAAVAYSVCLFVTYRKLA